MPHLDAPSSALPGLESLKGRAAKATSDCCPKRQVTASWRLHRCSARAFDICLLAARLHSPDRLQRLLQSAPAVHLSNRERLRSSTRCRRNADRLRVQGARRRARRSRGQGHDVWGRRQSCGRLRAVRRCRDAQELPRRDTRPLTASHCLGSAFGRLQRRVGRGRAGGPAQARAARIRRGGLRRGRSGVGRVRASRAARAG